MLGLQVFDCVRPPGIDFVAAQAALEFLRMVVADQFATRF